MLWSSNPKQRSYHRVFESSDEPYEPVLRGDGLSVETAFKETILPLDVFDDYKRYLSPIHGERGLDWTVVDEEVVATGIRHFFVSLVTIQLNNGELRKYYFNKSSNFKVLYADELEQRRKAREESNGWFVNALKRHVKSLLKRAQRR